MAVICSAALTERVNEMIENIKLVLKGGIFGIANVIPGVSGGTMAVVLGIYEQMIEAIGNFFTNREKRKAYFLFLFKVLLGAGITILIFSWIMDYLLNYYHLYTYFFFIGLIAGSIPAIYKTHPNMEPTVFSAITFLIGAGIVLTLSLSFPQMETNNPASTVIELNALQAGKLLFGGFLAGGSMIVPGVSGSFMLVLLGQYHQVIRAVKELNIELLIFLGIGIAAGIWGFAKLIDVLLKKFPKETFYFILGLVIASLYPIYPGLPASAGQVLIALALMIVAGGISYRLGEKR